MSTKDCESMGNLALSYPKKLAALLVLMMGLISVKSHAGKCDADPLSLITDVSWECMLPIRIGGVVEMGPNEGDPSDDTPPMVCVCSGGPVPKIGITVSFWEPSHLIETVHEPYCLYALGMQLANPKVGQQGGTVHHTNSDRRHFQQMHMYQFPVWSMMDMFLDVPCIEKNEFDVTMMTELLPTWSNDLLSAMINPEAVLFANPASIMACMADAASSLFNKPLDMLFWCMGSWGTAYPLAGTITGSDTVQANAALAARGIFLSGRLGMLKDIAVSGCGYAYTPIWNKSHYKLQMMRPVKDRCRTIGKQGMTWTSGKQKMINGDNYAWMMFRKVNCCLTY